MTPETIRKHYWKDHFSYKQAMHYLILIGFSAATAGNYLNVWHIHTI
jgi:hypothetical protein